MACNPNNLQEVVAENIRLATEVKKLNERIAELEAEKEAVPEPLNIATFREE